MNEPTPDWRTFSSRAAQPPGGGATVVPSVPHGRTAPSWTVVALVGVGAAALGAAGLVALLLVLGVGSSATVSGAAVPGAHAPHGFENVLGPTSGLPSDPRLTDRGVTIVVDVGGGVVDPGLRRLRTGDRVGDAIAAAGGFAPRADLAEAASALNLAAPLDDGMKVFVPVLGVSRAGASGSSGDGLIDINSADQALLETLPGVGPVTAVRIMEARAEQRFASVEELRSRGVLGSAVFEDVRDLVRAG